MGMTMKITANDAYPSLFLVIPSFPSVIPDLIGNPFFILWI